jgi:hypothetical protein
MNKNILEAITSEHELVAQLTPLSETQIFDFMQNLRGGTYFNMGMYSSIPVSRAYKASFRIYKVLNMTAIVSGVSYENVGTTKDFRDRTGKAAGGAWYDHMAGYENKIGVKKSDPNSKYVLWDIKESSGNWVRYFLVDIATGAVTPVSKEAVISSGYLTESEKAKLMPKKVEGYDKTTGALIENQTNWRTAKFENIFWLSQAGANAREYGTKFVESIKMNKKTNLRENREFNIFRDAHATISTDLDAILAGNIEESMDLVEKVDPKQWPEYKELTYEEAMELAKAYYSQGGDGFYETTEKHQFDDMVKNFGPMTVKKLKQDFGVFGSVYRDRMTESYRRTVSRGKSLNENELFVDFD